MKVAVNNYFSGNYERTFEINPYNPYLERIYNQINVLKEENKSNLSKGKFGVKVQVSPSSYEELLDKANELTLKALKEHQMFSLPFSIKVEIDTSKMPVEVLAQIIKTNSRKAQSLGNSVDKQANSVILMYTTRESYRKKIELKAQSKIDFATFKCEAKGCGKTNSHRTTLYAVIDKANGDIKYYGSSCVKKADGEGIIEYLDSTIKKINSLAMVVERVAKKPKDGLVVSEILDECINRFLSQSSKFYFQNQINQDNLMTMILSDKFQKDFVLPKIKESQDTIKYWIANDYDVKAPNAFTKKVSKSIANYLIKQEIPEVIKGLSKGDYQDFMKYLNRSRAIGSNRSNAKALLNNSKQDDLARGMTKSQMKEIINNALVQYTVFNASHRLFNTNDFKTCLNNYLLDEEKVKAIKNNFQMKINNLKVDLSENDKLLHYVEQLTGDNSTEKMLSFLMSNGFLKNSYVTAKLMNDEILLGVTLDEKTEKFINVKTSYFGAYRDKKVFELVKKYLLNNGQKEFKEKVNGENIKVIVDSRFLNFNQLHDYLIREIGNDQKELDTLQNNLRNIFVLIADLNEKGDTLNSLLAPVRQREVRSDETLLINLFRQEVSVAPDDIEYFRRKAEELENNFKEQNSEVVVTKDDLAKFLKQTTKVFIKKTFAEAYINKDKAISLEKDSGISAYGKWWRADFYVLGTMIGMSFFTSEEDIDNLSENIGNGLGRKLSQVYKDKVNTDILTNALIDLGQKDKSMLFDKGNNQKLIINSLKYMKNIIGKVRISKK